MSPSRVAAVRCDSYDSAQVASAISRGLSLLGGPKAFAASGERVVLKPNLLVGATPDDAVTTHPAVFAAVARALQETGASLSWGDSPAIGSTGGAGKRAGIATAAAELGVEAADFGKGRTESFPDGKLIKQFTIAEAVLDASGLVSLSKLKTHALTRMTGAIKNQFGCIPGMLKGEFHTRMPDVIRFSQMLVDLNRFLKPRLYVMDAVVGMEGNGPRGGTPRHVGMLLLATDPVALDAVACRIMALDPALVEPIVWGALWGLGTSTDIELVGDDVPVFEDYEVNRARRSTTGAAMGNPLGRQLLTPRPYVVDERCTRCGTCVSVCPLETKAVAFPGGDRTKAPVHDYGDCIRCYCCQELCPERAIEVKTPLLGRLIRR